MADAGFRYFLITNSKMRVDFIYQIPYTDPVVKAIIIIITIYTRDAYERFCRPLSSSTGSTAPKLRGLVLLM